MKKYSSTTKASYRRVSPKTRNLWLIISATTIIVGLLFPWFIGKISAVVLYPLHVTSTWIKTSGGTLPLYLRNRSELIAEVETLHTQISTGSGTQLSIQRLLEENMQLRSMTKAGKGEERLVANVLARPYQLAYDLLQINKGSKDGVVEGAPVFTGIDSVIGVVVHVTETYSFVDLFTSPGFESTAFIFGPNVFSPIEGMGGGVARVRLPQGVSISEGQLVILPGIDSGVYGQIVRVENQPTQPEQYGYITPPVSMNNLLYVSVGIGAVQVKTDTEINQVIRDQIRESLRLSSTTMYMYKPEEEVEKVDEVQSTPETEQQL